MRLPTFGSVDRHEAARALQALQNWPWLATVRTLWQRFREDRLGLTASSLTFTTTLALVPLVTVMLAAFSAFPIFAQFQGALQGYLLDSLVPDTIARPVLASLTQFAGKANRLGGAGLAVLLLTALALMLTIDRTLNNIWRVRAPRSMARRVLVYWAALTLGPLLLGMSLTIASYALSASRGIVGELPVSVSVLLGTLEFVLLAAGMAGLFHFVPNTHVRWRHAWAGGLFVAVGFELAKRGMTWYLAQVSTYATLYGAFATVPIFLIWLYLGWVIVLLGAVIAAYAPSLQMRMLALPDTPGIRFQLALGVLRELVRSRGEPARGLTALQIAQQLRTDPLQIEPLLDALVGIDWVGRLDEADNARYVLLCDPATTPAQALLAQLLLGPAPALHAFWQRAGFGEMTLGEIVRP